jgi:hypothetical protein
MTCLDVDMNAIVGRYDLCLITLDTLRYDVAARELELGHTPVLQSRLTDGKWELRHAPANFTYAAHQAFFAGFLPTPFMPGQHERLFALAFAGSETIGPRTCVLEADNIVAGLFARGYHTICIGGVGFFNLANPLGRVLPGLFAERHWDRSLGVTEPRSTENQVRLAIARLAAVPPRQRVFLFLNVAALHQPNCCYLVGAEHDTIESHAAALRYVDTQLAPLFDVLARRGTFCMVMSDHGTAYGDDGYQGHRLAHPCVWNVPYTHFLVDSRVGV